MAGPEQLFADSNLATNTTFTTLQINKGLQAVPTLPEHTGAKIQPHQQKQLTVNSSGRVGRKYQSTCGPKLVLKEPSDESDLYGALTCTTHTTHTHTHTHRGTLTTHTHTHTHTHTEAHTPHTRTLTTHAHSPHTRTLTTHTQAHIAHRHTHTLMHTQRLSERPSESFHLSEFGH